MAQERLASSNGVSPGTRTTLKGRPRPAVDAQHKTGSLGFLKNFLYSLTGLLLIYHSFWFCIFMGCVDVHTCVCLPINVSLMRFLCWLVCFVAFSFVWIFICLLFPKEKDGRCGMGWVGESGRKWRRGAHTKLHKNTIFNKKKIKKSYDNLKTNQDEGRRNPPHLIPSLILSR